MNRPRAEPFNARGQTIDTAKPEQVLLGQLHDSSIVLNEDLGKPAGANTRNGA
jgi:hypothetical protein